MCRKLLTIASMIAVVIAIPVEHNLLNHELIDLNRIDLVQLANLLMTPANKSGHMIEIDRISDKLKQGAKHISHLIEPPKANPVSDKPKQETKHISHPIESQKVAKIGAALLPMKVSYESAAIGAAIPAGAAIKGSLIGSAIATPIIVKSVALPGLAAAKTAAILSGPAILTHGAKAKVEEKSPQKGSPQKGSPQNGHNLLNKGTDALRKGALGVIGLAAKGALAMKTKAVVAGKLILRPIAIVTGAHLKFLGTGLTLAGKGVALTGVGIKKVGTGLKLGGLGAVGIGATAVGWGLDKTTIVHHLEEGHKFTKH